MAVLLNALKESCHLRCGSASPAMALSPAEQRQLTRSPQRPTTAPAFVEVERRSIGRDGAAGRRGSDPVGARARLHLTHRVAPGGTRPSCRRRAALLEGRRAALPTCAAAVAAPSRPKVIVQGVRVPLETPLLWLSTCAPTPTAFSTSAAKLASAPVAVEALAYRGGDRLTVFG